MEHQASQASPSLIAMFNAFTNSNKRIKAADNNKKKSDIIHKVVKKVTTQVVRSERLAILRLKRNHACGDFMQALRLFMQRHKFHVDLYIGRRFLWTEKMPENTIPKPDINTTSLSFHFKNFTTEAAATLFTALPHCVSLTIYLDSSQFKLAGQLEPFTRLNVTELADWFKKVFMCAHLEKLCIFFQGPYFSAGNLMVRAYSIFYNTVVQPTSFSDTLFGYLKIPEIVIGVWPMCLTRSKLVTPQNGNSYYQVQQLLWKGRPVGEFEKEIFAELFFEEALILLQFLCGEQSLASSHRQVNDHAYHEFQVNPDPRERQYNNQVILYALRGLNEPVSFSSTFELCQLLFLSRVTNTTVNEVSNDDD